MKSITPPSSSLLVLILLIFLSVSTNAQIIEKKSGNYYHNGELIPKEDLGDLMNTYRSSAELYNRHKELGGIAKGLGITTLVFYGAGSILLVKASNKECSDDLIGFFECSWFSKELAAGGLFVTIGSITGITALLASRKSKFKLKSAINMYNDSQLKSDHGFQETTLELNLKGNGISLNYTF